MSPFVKVASRYGPEVLAGSLLAGYGGARSWDRNKDRHSSQIKPAREAAARAVGVGVPSAILTAILSRGPDPMMTGLRWGGAVGGTVGLGAAAGSLAAQLRARTREW